MLAALRRIFLRIRLIIGGIRSALYGIVVVAITWIIVLPPSQSEIARLDLPANATVEAEGLRHYRMAKLLLLVASEKTFERIAARSGSGVSGSEFQLAVQIAANGAPIQNTSQPEHTGAKRISARVN